MDNHRYIVISGDFIAYTSLKTSEKKKLEDDLKQLFITLKETFNTFSRLIKGDYLECVVPNPQDGLTVMLAIKTYIKSLEIDESADSARTKIFQTYSIRLAMGLGTLDRFDRDLNIIDGDAIYRSGRAITNESTHNKERVVIKNTLFFSSNNDQLNYTIDTLIALLDHLLTKATSKQNEVLYLKIMGNSEKTIAKLLGVSQPSVNQHSTASGWNAIEKALTYFSHILK